MGRGRFLWLFIFKGFIFLQNQTKYKRKKRIFVADKNKREHNKGLKSFSGRHEGV